MVRIIAAGQTACPRACGIGNAAADAGAAARVFDKVTYSPWVDGRLFSHLRQEEVRTLAVTGGKTDVCVLATVLWANDLGFHVIVSSDAVCRGADETHDASVGLLGDRFSVQLELLETEEFLSSVSR